MAFMAGPSGKRDLPRFVGRSLYRVDQAMTLHRQIEVRLDFSAGPDRFRHPKIEVTDVSRRTDRHRLGNLRERSGDRQRLQGTPVARPEQLAGIALRRSIARRSERAVA